MSEQEPPLADVEANKPFHSLEKEWLDQIVSAEGVQAETIIANNVVSGIQINFFKEQSQKRVPPLQRPRRAEHFVDRKTEQIRILADLKPGRIATICGPGGMGKTALVAEILWSLAPGDKPPAAFPDGLFFHSFYGQPDAAIALEQIARAFGEEPLPTPALAAQRALSGLHAVLVLDGAEEADDLKQVLAVCVDCAVLVTNRQRSDAADPVYRLDLQPLPRDKAIDVLQAWGGKRAANETDTTHICEIVGDLPLALRLIGRYLAQQEEEASEYLHWLQEDTLPALDLGTSKWESIPILLERSMAKLSTSARRELIVIGIFALAPFDREMVAKVLNFSSRAASLALGELVNYGLVVRLGTLYEVSHPLIHTYAHKMLLTEYDLTSQGHLTEQAALVLAKLFPEVKYQNWEVCEKLLPHVQACALLIDQHELTIVEAAYLLHRAGAYLRERAGYEQAEPLLKRALTIYEKALGLVHPDTAQSLNDLALLYEAQGKYEQAEPLLQKALTIREQALGPLHPDVATSLNNLGILYLNLGNYELAEPLLQRALAIREQALGPLHPYTAISLNNLALLSNSQGRYEQAELLYQRSLAIREQALDPLHPDIASSLNNLGFLYRAQGRYEEAEPLLQRALAIREQMLAPLHPHITMSCYHLAMNYAAQGKYEQAETLLQRASAISETQLGLAHPSTILILKNYSSLLRMLDRESEAIELERKITNYPATT